MALVVSAGQGSITVPGAIAATPVEAPIDVEEGTLPADVPLVYYYGHSNPRDSPELYTYLVERLAAVLERRVTFIYGGLPQFRQLSPGWHNPSLGA